jgi:biotin carboxylase
MSFQEMGVWNAALIREKLGIRGNPLEPVRLTRDKGEMRRHLESANIPSIPYAIIRSRVEAEHFIETFGLPVILKPLQGAGSFQIGKVERLEQLEAALANSQDGFFKNDHSLIETFMEGTEISVEAWSHEGKHTVVAVTDKITTGAPYFVETGHSVPSLLDAACLDRVKNITVLFLSSIGHTIGPSHTELMVTKQGPILIESHTRTGGDYIYELVRRVYGFDFFEATLTALKNRAPASGRIVERGCAIVRYFQLPEGKVEAVEGVEEALQSDGVIKVELQIEVGQELRPFTNSDERPGYVAVYATDREAAELLAAEAMNKVRVRICKRVAL